MTRTNTPAKISNLPIEVFSTLNELVCITDVSNHILYINPALKKRAKPLIVEVGQAGFWDVPLEEITPSNTPVEFRNIYSNLWKEWFDLTVHHCETENGKTSFLWIAKEVIKKNIETQSFVDQINPESIRNLYHTLFETSPSGILLCDENGIIINVNQSICTSTGYAPIELIDQHVSKLMLPEDHNTIGENIKQILSGKILKREVTSLRKDGSFFYSFLVESALTLPDGRRAVLCRSNDITECKQAALHLKKQETWFRSIANHTANWESLFNNEGRIIWTNPAAERFTGYTPEEIIAMPDIIEQLVALPDRKKARSVLTRALKKSEGYDHFFRFIQKDGTYFWLSISWVHLHDEDNNLIGIRTSGQDVTLRLDAAQALRSSERQYRHMVENAPFGMHFFEINDEKDLIFTHANPAADLIIGIDHLKIAGKKIEDAFPGLIFTEAPQRFKEAAIHNKTWITDHIQLNNEPNGAIYEVKAFQTVKGKMLAIFADISKRYWAEDQLRESRQLFETLARMAPVGIFRTNALGETTYVNPRWSSLTGFLIPTHCKINI